MPNHHIIFPESQWDDLVVTIALVALWIIIVISLVRVLRARRTSTEKRPPSVALRQWAFMDELLGYGPKRLLLGVVVGAVAAYVSYDNTFRQFARMDSSQDQITFAYFLGRSDKAIRTSEVVDISLESGWRGRYALLIRTRDGARYRSLRTRDEAALQECRDLVTGFRKTK